MMENYRIPGDQIHVTINGINTRQFSPGPPDPALKQELGLGDGPVVVLVSRLDESRALAAKRLIEIAPDFPRQCPTWNCCWWAAEIEKHSCGPLPKRSTAFADEPWSI